MSDDPTTQNPAALSSAPIRTYAKDVAALTGKALPKNVKNTPKEPSAAPIPAPAPEPKKEESKVPPTPLPEPPPAKIIPKAPSTDESKEAVLARLKARANNEPVPVVPSYTPVPKAPSTEATPESVLARLKAKAGAPAAPKPTPAPAPAPVVPPGIPPVQKPDPMAPAPIHTYKTDFTDKTKREGATPISVIAAEQDQGVAAPVVLSTKKPNRLPTIAAAVLLIVAGGASLVFAFRYIASGPLIPIEPFVPSLIVADERVRLEGSGEDLRQALAALPGDELRGEGVVVAYFTYASTTEDGVIEIPATGGALIEALRLGTPDILSRNIAPESTVGAIRAGGDARPFFIFRVSSYERSFSGMLAWEATMEQDLALFYPPHPVEVPLIQMNASSTATTTPTPVPFRASFVDEVIDNHDARVLRDRDGHAIMLYGYRDKETLVIARDEAAFSAILTRLATTRAE